MRPRRTWRWWTTAAAVVGLLCASGAAAVAAPTVSGSVSPHRLVRADILADVDVWNDRADESWLCSLLAFGCGALPQRPTGPNDIPAAQLATSQQAWIHCWKGNYYLIDYGLGEQLGWIVADQALIRPHDDGRGPQQCTAFDDAT